MKRAIHPVTEKFLDDAFYTALANQGPLEGSMELRWDKADAQVRACNPGTVADVLWVNPMSRSGFYGRGVK